MIRLILAAATAASTGCCGWPDTPKFDGHPGTCEAIAFSPDGKHLAAAGNGSFGQPHGAAVTLWEVAGRRKVAEYRGRPGHIDAIAFSADGAVLDVAFGPHWEPARRRTRLTVPDLKEETFPPNDPERLARVIGARRASATEARAFGVDDGAWAEDGTMFAGVVFRRVLLGFSAPRTGCETIAVFDAGSRRVVERIPAIPDAATALAFSPKGDALAVGGNGSVVFIPLIVRKRGTDRFALIADPNTTAPDAAQLPAGALVRLGTVPFRHPGRVYSVAFSPDGRTLATAGARVVRFWHVATARELHRTKPQYGVGAVAYFPDGRSRLGGSSSPDAPRSPRTTPRAKRRCRQPSQITGTKPTRTLSKDEG